MEQGALRFETKQDKKKKVNKVYKAILTGNTSDSQCEEEGFEGTF